MSNRQEPARFAGIQFSSSHRTKLVWGALAAAMVLACSVLTLADASLRSARGAPMLGPMSSTEPERKERLLESAIDLDEDRWRGIVIHHSGSPAGDADSLNRMHIGYGLDGLGYHFVIGNGKGLGDGVIHASQRWMEQRAGAHAIGDDADFHNRHSIAICLIGNGETAQFTTRQMERLIALTRALQQRFSIPATEVALHRDIADVRSPGRYFAEAAFRGRLIRD